MSIQLESTGLHHYLDSDGELRSGYDSEAVQRIYTEQEYPGYSLSDLLEDSGANRTQKLFDRVCIAISILAIAALVILLLIN
jgi:hypothetical protein